MGSLVTELKTAWGMLPANARLTIHGATAAATGAAFSAFVMYLSTGGHPLDFKLFWPLVAAAAGKAVMLYFQTGPMAQYKWDRAIEKGETVERRGSPEVMPPSVVVLPENPPGDPLNEKKP